MLLKFLLPIATLVVCCCEVRAQTPAPTPSTEVLQSCLLGTQLNIWTALQLNRDQLQRVLLVQEACKEECDVAGVKKQTNTISNANGSTVMSELDNILSEDQYRAWLAYCSGSPVEGQTPK